MYMHNVPTVATSSDVEFILNKLQSCKVCPGNPDEAYVSMVESKKGIMKCRKGQTTSCFVDSSISVTIGEQLYHSTVRTSDCDFIISGTSTRRCAKCVKYRNTLRSSYTNYQKGKDEATAVSSHTNFRFVSTPQRSARGKKRRVQVGNQKRRIKVLEEKVKRLIKGNGVAVDDELHDGLLHIMNSAESNESPESSLQKIFWTQQLKAASVADKRLIRWHPLIIKWCLSLKLKSSSAYRAMKDTGFIRLPSERTLRDYTHVFKAKPGIQEEVSDQIAKEVNIDELEPWQTNVCIIFDEVKIKEGLVYDKHTGYILGFVELGDVNKCIDELETTMDKRDEIATHMLVFMIRGIFIKLHAVSVCTISLPLTECRSFVLNCMGCCTKC